ncbi:hypothetical protein [Adlercreutzia sp. ZJ138]|uniref:hypothetical protein n=1 Tax=Adlercreutzia sp. ZJ138 TaxID=2709405 RepID=UPI0013EDA986|nr:hypothetical protein [Adlercreutzia sp. ZJ138]
MATATMQKEPQDGNDNRRKNVFNMMSDIARTELHACENVTMGAMSILSLQADETEAQLQNKNLSDNDRSKFFEERAAIRHDAIHLADVFNAKSVLKVLGTASIFAACFGVGYGAGRYVLRIV